MVGVDVQVQNEKKDEEMEETRTNEPHSDKTEVKGPDIQGQSESDKKDEEMEVKTNERHSDKNEEEVNGLEIRGQNESDKKEEGMEHPKSTEQPSDKEENVRGPEIQGESSKKDVRTEEAKTNDQHSDKKQDEVKEPEIQGDKKDERTEETKTGAQHSDKKQDEVKEPEIQAEGDKEDERTEETKSDEQHSDKKQEEVKEPEIQGDKKDERTEEAKSDEQHSDKRDEVKEPEIQGGKKDERTEEAKTGEQHRDKKQDEVKEPEVQVQNEKKDDRMEETKSNEQQPSDKMEEEVKGPEVQRNSVSEKEDDDIMEVDLEGQSEKKDEKGTEAEGEEKSSQKDEADKEVESKEPGTSEKKDDGNVNPDNEEEEEEEEPPKIFLRNLAEIMEPDSDDDDDITCLTDTPTFYRVDEQNRMIPVIGTNVSNNNNSLLPSQSKVPTTSTTASASAGALLAQRKLLASKATYDTELADVEMSCQADPAYKTNVNMDDRRIPLISQKLLGWFTKRKARPPQKNQRPPNQSQPPTLLPIRTVAPMHPPETPQLIRMNPSAPVSTPATIHLPGTPVHGLPVTAINWTPQFRSPAVTVSGQHFVTNVTAGTPMITQVRSTRPNATVVSGPRQLININSKNTPGGQIIFDPTTGLILYPTNSIIQQQPNSVGQQPQLLPQGIRLQNGMVIRPEAVSYTPRSGVENNTFAPTHAQIANRMNLQVQQPIMMQQRGPAPVRNTFVTPRAPMVTPRTSAPGFLPQRPLTNILPAPSFRGRTVTNVRMTPAAPVTAQQQISPYQVHQPPPPPVQIPLRQVAPNLKQYVNPRMAAMSLPAQRQPTPEPPLRHSVPRLKHQLQPPPKVPRLNGITNVFDILPNGEPRGVIEKNITAGNQKPIPGTITDADNDLQNKTFPSLVVHVKTCLASKLNRQLTAKKRSDLDAEVKGVLVHPPARFTEWLMSRQLIRGKDILCPDHARTLGHLGQYTDTNREPFSGGYVWIPVCCPRRYTSVFNGSIFEGSKYPPGTLIKLIYHWSVQTPASNILQWVKVSSAFLKNFFTMIRAICISWLHERCPPMGGEMRYVEIGVITLGSSAETSRGVKNVNVEILGVFDPSTKIVRMKVINSLQGQLFKDRIRKPDAYEQGARAFQILWPLTHWVDKRSILLVDGIIDKALFHELGFRNVQQCGPDTKTSPNNINIMNYLRNLVPKMFSSTLSVLSKSIVQQFLDELSWREIYASDVKTCYVNILNQAGELTTWDLGSETLISRLNKVNQNPFLDWSFTKQTRRCPLNTIPLALRNEPGIQECIRHVMKEDNKPKPALPKIPPPPPVRTSTPSQLPPMSRSFPHNLVPRKSTAGPSLPPPPPPRPVEILTTTRKRKVADPPAQTNLQYYRNYYSQSVKQYPVQYHYYGEIPSDKNDHIQTVFPNNLKCPLCVRIFTSANDILRHMYLHVGTVSLRNSENLLCYICLKELPTGVTMQHHLALFHKMTDFLHACRICEERFRGEQEFVIHMWDLHSPNEAPYRCSMCNFGTSFHFRMIDHFHEEHGGEGNVICPFCLKSLPALSQTNLKLIISHLQSHNSRRAKKCARCALSFICEADLETHQADHLSQKSQPRWEEYVLCEREDLVLMAFPPQSKTPLRVKLGNPIRPLNPPPPKKQKLNNTAPKKKEAKSTLNASFAVPIDTNEKCGGVRYKINLPHIQGKKATCLECKQEIGSSDHFIGRLSCTKCRYVTACQMAMDLHHKVNHLPGSKRVPGLPSKKIKRLGVSLQCECGFASVNPYKLATHLVQCDKLTVKPKPGKILEQNKSTNDKVTMDEGPPKLPKEPDPTTISTSNSESSQNEPSLSNSLGILNNAPVTTFDDMLSLDESMGCAFGTLALPSLMSPTEPMLDSSLNSPSFSTSSSSTAQTAVQSQSSTVMANTDTSTTNNWDPDSWDLPSMPGLIAKCKCILQFSMDITK